jgi:hypothetical protein
MTELDRLAQGHCIFEGLLDVIQDLAGDEDGESEDGDEDGEPDENRSEEERGGNEEQGPNKAK